jgi:endonuclease V-like protein UPF0215 family
VADRFPHVVGFDDGSFPRGHRGDVVVVGAVFSGPRLEGMLAGRVRRDGANATARLAAMVASSQFAGQLRLILLQGVALAGFNVVDVEALSRRTGLAVLVVARRRPDFAAIRRALLGRVRGGERKWRLIERLGEMEPAAGLYVQRKGITLDEAGRVLSRLALHSHLPEPLRVAHLAAGAFARGRSRGRV